MTPPSQRRSGGFWLPAATLWQREVVRFLRQRDRVAGALLTPLVFWLVIGWGVGSSFRPDGIQHGEGYLEYFYPGALMMMVLFTAISSTISIIEDRREGFLQGVLVSPASRGSIVFGKILGGTTLGLLQGVLILALMPAAGISFSAVKVATSLAVLTLAAFALTGLGFVLAWSMETIQGFHAIMNLFLLPLWLLSGAAFPASGAASWMRTAMAFNPLTYPMAALRRALVEEGGGKALLDDLPSWEVSLGVAVALSGLMFALALWVVFRREQNNAP